jgi:hypothetical protein
MILRMNQVWNWNFFDFFVCYIEIDPINLALLLASVDNCTDLYRVDIDLVEDIDRVEDIGQAEDIGRVVDIALVEDIVEMDLIADIEDMDWIVDIVVDMYLD